jgi:DNA-binding MarR family transcriptional regulator
MTKRANVEQQLCKSIAGELGSAVLLFNSALAERLGMSVTDFKTVAALQGAGPINPGRLSALTGMSTAATTLVLDRLERAGLVRRERDPNDGRKVIVQPITDPALNRDLARIFEGLAQSMSAVMGTYSTDQLEAVRDFFAQTTEVLQGVAVQLRTGRAR